MLPGTKMSTIVVMYKTWKHLCNIREAQESTIKAIKVQLTTEVLVNWASHPRGWGELRDWTGPRNRRAPMSHACKGREGKYAKAQNGVYKVTNAWMQPTRQWNINVQSMFKQCLMVP